MRIPERPKLTNKSHKFKPFKVPDPIDRDYRALHTDTPITKVCMDCGQQKHYRLHLRDSK